MRASAALAAGAAVTGALVASRVVREPVPVYGDSGAGWIEHMARLDSLLGLQQASGGPVAWLRAADGLYPPGLHLLTLPVALLSDHSVVAVGLTGLAWLALLAAATGALARRWGPEAGAVAALAVVLSPGLHGAAARHYYDLPMVALVWTAAALLVAGRGARAGLGAALVFGLACLVKWSALPLGLPVLAAAALVRARAPGGRTALGALAAAGLGLGLALHALALPSLGAMGGATFQPPPGVALTATQAARAAAGPLGQAVVMLELGLADGLLWDRLGFYLGRTVGTALGPAHALATLAVLCWGLATGDRRSAGGAVALAALAGLPVLAFLVLVVPPLDDRFLLGLLPVLALGTARGWSRLPRRARPLVLGAVLATGLATAADLHLGALAPVTGGHGPAESGHTVPLRAGAGASFDRRGWARAVQSPDPRRALRARLWAALAPCPARRIAGSDALIDPRGDLNWWGHQTRLAAVRGDPHWSWVPGGTGELWLRPDPADAWGAPAAPPAGMRRVGSLRDPAGGPGIQIWQADHIAPCPALDAAVAPALE